MLKLKPEFSHLRNYQTFIHGPIQQDEALFLLAVCKMVRPKVILEFGVLDGMSTYNFAVAKDSDCLLFSFDLNPEAVENGRRKVAGFPNCFLGVRNCTEFVPSDVRDLPIDFFFLDCAHVLEINQECLRRVIPCMSPEGIIGIHDTGYYTKKGFDAAPEDYKRWKEKLGERLERQDRVPVILDETKTANWLTEEFPEYNSMHFHSANYFRHGISLFQKKRVL